MRVNLNSFDRLERVAKHENIRSHVKTISYDASTIDTLAAAIGFQRWLECSAGDGLGLIGDVRDAFLEQFSNSQLRKYYIGYCQYGLGQDELLRQNYAESRLFSALRKFPSITAIRFAVRPWRNRSFREEVPSLNSLSPVAQTILAEPDGYSRYEDTDAQF